MSELDEVGEMLYSYNPESDFKNSEICYQIRRDRGILSVSEPGVNKQLHWAAERIEVLEARVEALEGILDSISDMEGREGMTDAEFVKEALLNIKHGNPWPNQDSE